MMGEIFRQERTDAARDEPADDRVVRLHRTYLARFMCRDRDVLDLHAGDGATAAVLAQTARSVRAVVATTAAMDTARASFAASNLAFDLAPPPDSASGSFDVILDLGSVLQSADPGAAIAAWRRLLRPGGRLLLGLADREMAPPPLLGGRETGRAALNRAEWQALVGAHFAHVVVLGQRGLVGSAMVGAGGDAPLVLAHRGLLQVEAAIGLPRAAALFCVASDTPIDDVADSLFIDSDLDALAEMQDRAVQATSDCTTLRTDLAALAEQHGQRGRTDAAWRHELAVLRVNEAAAVARADTARAQCEAAERLMFATLAETERGYLSVLEGMQARERQIAGQLTALQQQQVGLARRIRRRLGLLRSGRSGARIAAVKASALFDAAWYRQRYPDVAAAGIDPATHYVRSGAAEQRDPGPAFDGAWYRAQHPDIDAERLSPLEHYEDHGRAPGWPTRAPDPPQAAAPRPANPLVLFVSGEADTPGSQYRCVRYAAAAREAGWSADWRPLEHTGAVQLIGVAIIVLWRVRYSDHVAGIIREVRTQGGTVVFDVDDLMFKPELAQTRIIDGIRTTNAGINSTRATFAQVQQAMLAADLCTAPTEELASHMREWQRAAYVLPNGFDDATHARARLAVRRRATGPSDGAVRIGYAAGTVTHQKDFLVALPALLRVLDERPAVRLVLFRAPDTELVVIAEFDDLSRHAERIEWRDAVTLDDLPNELARFDINIAPLELDNPFCEAKSELKYFEAALVGVPTVASPTGPFARAIAHGRTGLLAADDAAWHEAMLRLVDDADQRHAIGRNAYNDCLWQFGPRRRAELTHGFLEQVSGTAAGARAFALAVLAERDTSGRNDRARLAQLPPADTVFCSDRMGQSAVTVIVPCYNYADYIIDALESVRAQTLDPLDLVVVDDCSTDALTIALIAEWTSRHADRFNRLVVLRHTANAGLGAARNTGFDAAETPYVLPLDADNRLRPDCCERLLAVLQGTSAAYAYPSLQMFGADDAVFCNERYQPTRLVGGNYIDAMALIAKWAWAACGGYDMSRDLMGWEDFDLWCSLAERGQRGVHVGDILADYRVHGASMIASLIEQDVKKQHMVATIEHRHDWLRLLSRRPRDRV